MNGIPEYGTGRHEDYLSRLDEERAAADPVPDSAEAAYDQWIAERDPADVGSSAGFTAGWRAALAAAGGWPLCPNGCGCRLGTEDADRKECACDGLCCYDEVEVSEVFAERDRLKAAAALARAAVQKASDARRDLDAARAAASEVMKLVPLGRHATPDECEQIRKALRAIVTGAAQ